MVKLSNLSIEYALSEISYFVSSIEPENFHEAMKD